MKYTGGLWVRASRLMEPEVLFSGLYLLFLALAFFSFYIPSTSNFLLESFSKPKPSSYLLSLFGITLFFLTAMLGKRRKLSFNSRVILLAIALLAFFSLQITFPSLLPLNILASLVFILFFRYFSSHLGSYSPLALACLGIAGMASLSILVFEIPILVPGAREEVAVTPQRAVFHGFGMLAGVLMVAFFKWSRYLPAILLLSILGLLSGFKSDAISIILASLLAGLYLGKFGPKEAVVTFALIGGILTVVSNFIAKVSYFTWKLSPLLYPVYRSGFTFSVFDKIAQSALPWGITHGRALADTRQVVASKSVLGYQEEHIITSTLFGPALLDFGVIGVAALALLLGYYLGVMRALASSSFSTALLAVALAHLIILIEVGLQPTSLIFLSLLLYLSMREKENEG